jgi:hypothetical protein
MELIAIIAGIWALVWFIRRGRHQVADKVRAVAKIGEQEMAAQALLRWNELSRLVNAGQMTGEDMCLQMWVEHSWFMNKHGDRVIAELRRRQAASHA